MRLETVSGFACFILVVLRSRPIVGQENDVTKPYDKDEFDGILIKKKSADDFLRSGLSKRGVFNYGARRTGQKNQEEITMEKETTHEEKKVDRIEKQREESWYEFRYPERTQPNVQVKNVTQKCDPVQQCRGSGRNLAILKKLKEVNAKYKKLRKQCKRNKSF